ncbi:MAG: HAMP domain-containing histidine kinase [Candidatus Omnitrophica bacterium]|nr:HAMP domain-containing histidine kinase [Candidatus Omnitrophota bacterium]
MSIKTVLSKDKNNIEIIFSDTGYGIAKGNADKIFTPFFKTKHYEEGMGMGLSIVKGIIENHKGQIEFNSVKDEGTTLRL